MLKVFRRGGQDLVVVARCSWLLVSSSLPSSPDLGGGSAKRNGFVFLWYH